MRRRAKPFAPHLHVSLEGVALDNLSCAGCVHADDAAVAQVEHVAGIGQLVVMLDGDDAEALTTHEAGELNALTAHGRADTGMM